VRASVGLVQPGKFSLELLRPPAKCFSTEVDLLRVNVTRFDARDDEALPRQQLTPPRGLEWQGRLTFDDRPQEPRDQRTVVAVLNVQLAKDAGLVER
jgi:hypothetical protein